MLGSMLKKQIKRDNYANEKKNNNNKTELTLVLWNKTRHSRQAFFPLVLDVTKMEEQIRLTMKELKDAQREVEELRKHRDNIKSSLEQEKQSSTSK